MSYIDTKGKFHIALNGQGLILQGTPDRMAYQAQQAPLYNTRFGQGDRSYSDFSFWWFWAQSSFAAGYKQEKVWEDDGKFGLSEGVNVIERTGSVVLNWKQLNTQGTAKDMTYNHGGDASGTHVLVGRNNTDQKMRADNAYSGANIWEDSATGANEEIICTGEFGDGELYIGCKTVGSGASMLKKGTGGAFADVGAHNAGSGIYQIVPYPDGDAFYLFTFNAGIYRWVRSSGTYTQMKTSYPYGTTASLWSVGAKNGQRAWLIGDRIYFLLNESNLWRAQLWAYDIADDAYVHIYTFGAGVNPDRLIPGNNGALYLFDTNNNINRVQIWKYTPSTGVMEKIHEIGRDSQTSNIVAVPVKDAESLYFAVDDGSSDFQIWQLDNEDALFCGVTPPAAFAADIDLLTMSGTGNLVVVKNGGSGTNKYDMYDAKPNNDRQTTGFVQTSEFDGNIPALDKLFYDVTINFDTLVSGQAIEVQYSTNGGSSFTSLGSASYSSDGAINTKIFVFGTNIVAKKMILKFILTGGGTNTPAFNDFSARYIPFVNYTKLWTLQVNCADEVKTLSGRHHEYVGREVKGLLERSWWTKSVLDFQDLDYASTALDGALNDSATTITVDNTADFPEQGRIRIDNEEIFYTGKTPTTFTGCTRGVRETRPASHSDNVAVHNGYKVILTELQYRIPVALEGKELEYIVGIQLREV